MNRNFYIRKSLYVEINVRSMKKPLKSKKLLPTRIKTSALPQDPLHLVMQFQEIQDQHRCQSHVCSKQTKITNHY